MNNTLAPVLRQEEVENNVVLRSTRHEADNESRRLKENLRLLTYLNLQK